MFLLIMVMRLNITILTNRDSLVLILVLFIIKRRLNEILTLSN